MLGFIIGYSIALVVFYALCYFIIPNYILKSKLVPKTQDTGKKIVHVGDTLHILYEPAESEKNILANMFS